MNEENTEGLSLESKLSLIRGRGGGIKIKWLIHFIHFLPLKGGGGGRWEGFIRDGGLQGFKPYFRYILCCFYCTRFSVL